MALKEYKTEKGLLTWFKLFPVLMGMFLLPAVANAQSAANLDGAYQRVSLTNPATGESPEAANRKGLLIMAHGHYSMITIRPDRRTLSAGQKLSDLSETDQIAFLQEWLDINAHSGRYEIDGDTVAWHRDLSEDPKEVGTTTRLRFEQRDDLLVLHFGLANGQRYEWVWRKLR